MRNTTFISVDALAKAWGVHKATIIRRIACGDIPAINIAPKGSPVNRWRIPASEADRPGMTSAPKKSPRSRKRTK